MLNRTRRADSFSPKSACPCATLYSSRHHSLARCPTIAASQLLPRLPLIAAFNASLLLDVQNRKRSLLFQLMSPESGRLGATFTAPRKTQKPLDGDQLVTGRQDPP